MCVNANKCQRRKFRNNLLHTQIDLQHFFLKRYTALSFKTDMTARFCACNENKAASAKKTTAIACRMESCVATQAGGNAPPQVGGLLFWVFSAYIIWRRWVGTGLW